jgi:hypothetical protein
MPFVMSDDAETMDKMFWGTEQEIERMCAAVLINAVNLVIPSL